MTEVKGVWYPAGSSRQVPATFRGEKGRFIVTTEEDKIIEGKPGALDVSSRVGNINRKLTLPDLSVFETGDNDGIDAWLKAHKGVSGRGWLHYMETRWSWIGIALLVVVAVVYSASRYGLPWVSAKVAQHMPQNVVEYVSRGSLDLLDRLILEPTELEAARRDAIEARFHDRFGQTYRLHFRRMGMANALALPNGGIVVSDQFVQLATNPEFDAVMFHEAGHIELRHGMQQLVQSSIVAFVVALVLGEPSGLEEAIVALPVFLMQSHYSRKHESAADEFAFRQMMDRGIDPIHFSRIMKKLESAASQPVPDGDETAGGDRSIAEYLSSHPATRQRIAKAEALSRAFNQQQSD